MEQRTVKTSRRKYDAEFKKEVIKMIESGRSVPEVAQSLGIGNNLIYYWVKPSKKKGIALQSKVDDSFDEDKATLHKK